MKGTPKKSVLTVFLLALVLRFYQLGAKLADLDWDEVSSAYNAHSILKTGHDKYNNFLPLYNRSFDDYKIPFFRINSQERQEQ